MFKVNNRNTRARCEIRFTPCSSVSVVNFEQVNADWDRLLQEKDLGNMAQFPDVVLQTKSYLRLYDFISTGSFVKNFTIYLSKIIR